MKNIPFFRAGNHTCANGITADFSESVLSAIASNYDPKLHEAPLVIGHPKDNKGALGWVKSVSFSDGKLSAEPQQVNADFEESVKAGAFKKVSASFYTPDSPNNPTKGAYYLRHIGFLGAMPPAIKGLEPIEFNESEELIEFSETLDYSDDSKTLMQAVTDKINSIFGRIEKLEQQQTTEFNEEKTGDNVDLEEIKAKLEAAEKLNKQLSDQVANFNESAAQQRKDKIENKISALVEAGKILPCEKAAYIAFAENMPEDQTLEFGEGEEKQNKTMLDSMLHLLEALPNRVDFNEHTADNAQDNNKEITGDMIANYCEKHSVDAITALNELKKGAK